MKKSISLVILLIVFLFTHYYSLAQVGEWVWIHGSQTPNTAANYGIKGVASATNVPRALYEACEWTDTLGNFWLYGGLNSGFGNHNDLWKYDPVINQWTWMTGTQATNDAGNYGTQGIPSVTNRPPSKAWGPASWVDLNGNLWMLGGMSGGVYADLWKYDISTNIWTWMKGPSATGQAGVYGTQGVSAPGNYPGARYEVAVTWTDNSGNLWLFGGHNGASGYNDLWKYSISTNEWTWMKGANVTGQAGIYGVKGIAAPANTPGGRAVYSRWKDNNGNFWLFGGGVPDISYPFNDLWKYDMATNNWTWMSGSNSANATGLYGTKCVPAASNVPGARFENRAAWTDSNGDFWMFGGAVGSSFQKVWNDLWKYCVATERWIWEAGDTISNPIGNWGILGVSSPSNRPNGRAGAIAWKDKQGHLYLFGGTTNTWPSNYNDLWKFTIDPSCGTCSQSVPQAGFISSDTTFCDESGKCIDFTDQSTGSPTTWQWLFPGATPDTSSQQNPTNICYNLPGTYDVTLIIANAAGSDTVTVSPLIIFSAGASAPVITVSQDTLYCSPAVTYQWYFNGLPIAGATDSFYIATQDGNYNIYITDSFGCGRLASGPVVWTHTDELLSGQENIRIYPNPVGDRLEIWGLKFSARAAIKVFNVLGEDIYSSQLIVQKSQLQTNIDVSFLSSGIYIVEVRNGEKVFRAKFVKE